MTTRRVELLFIGGLVLALCLLQSTGIGRPFLRQHESNGTEFGKHARNHLKFGLGKTLGLMLDVSGPRLEAYENHRDYFYSNHPPLSALLLAAAFALFGVCETTFRAFLIAMSILALLLFRRLAAGILRPPYDRVATALFTLLPMFVYYSIVTCLQVVALIGVLGAFLFYLRWRSTQRPRDYAGIVISIVFACYSSWEGYYVAPALIAAHVWSRRPGTRAVLGLLGVNVAVFGVYLLHLWSADPLHLAPIRSLLSAGASRSSFKDLPLLAYVLGEAREIALLFTLPVLAMAGCWIFTLIRGPREESDGLIAGAAFLGLHEILFATLASGHEYYSYFLIVFAALAAAAGLQRLTGWIRVRSHNAALAAGILLACAFLGQAAWILPRRLLKEGGYEFYYKLGIALDGATRPQDRVLILTHNSTFYTPFYGDRYSQYYEPASGELVPENSGGRRSGVTEKDVLDLLRTNSGRFDVAVTADKSIVVPQVRWLQGMDDATLERFGVDTHRTPRRDLLEQICGPPREHGGFLFWDLRSR
jgi:hypothetical protein